MSVRDPSQGSRPRKSSSRNESAVDALIPERLLVTQVALVGMVEYMIMILVVISRTETRQGGPSLLALLEALML